MSNKQHREAQAQLEARFIIRTQKVKASDLVMIMCGYRGQREKMEPGLRTMLSGFENCHGSRREEGLPSLDHGQHSRHHLLLDDEVDRCRVLNLQDDLIGLTEELLSHHCLNSMVPRSQLGMPFKDGAATTYRLYQEGNRMGVGERVAKFGLFT